VLIINNKVISTQYIQKGGVIISKILVDEKDLNQLLYAARFHIDLIKTDKFFSTDDLNLNKMRESIDRMNEAIIKFDSPIKLVKQLKRKLFTKYIESKKELADAIKLKDPDLITYCESVNKKDLANYLKVKETCEREESN
jgi:hypothetical protein